jgi:hypothetical protein
MPIPQWRYVQFEYEDDRIHQCLMCYQYIHLACEGHGMRFCPYCGIKWEGDRHQHRHHNIPRWEWDRYAGELTRLREKYPRTPEEDLRFSELHAVEASFRKMADRAAANSGEVVAWLRMAADRRSKLLRQLKWETEAAEEYRPTAERDADGYAWYEVCDGATPMWAEVYWIKLPSGRQGAAFCGVRYEDDVMRYNWSWLGSDRPVREQPTHWYGKLGVRT